MHLPALVLFLPVVAVRCIDFDYTGDKGPESWPKIDARCGCSRQSPIVIQKKDIVVNEGLTGLELRNFSAQIPRNTLTVVNNGHSLGVLIPSDREFFVTGAGLTEAYRLLNIHFHWDHKTKRGSEHEIGNVKYAAEMHMVHLKGLATTEDALNMKDGIAVVAIFLEVREDAHENAELNKVLTAFSKLTVPGSSANISETMTLRKLLPSNLTNFFRYQGSLTVPPCSEVVEWIVLQDTVLASRAQIDRLRLLATDHGGSLAANHRPVQPLGDRKVFVRSNVDFGQWRANGGPNGWHGACAFWAVWTVVFAFGG